MNLNDIIRKKVIPHRRGIMGTVIFHLALVIFLLGREIRRMSVHSEMDIVVEAPEVKEVQKRQETERRKEEIRRKSADEEVDRMLRSIAVNENVKVRPKDEAASVRKYVDEILEELQEEGGSGRYRARKDKHFSQDSLQHLRDRRERTADSLKSTFYSGESSVSYNLKGRFARFLPIPVFKCEFGGKVMVEITVNPKGTVQKAVVMAAHSRADENLWRVAVDAAGRSRFNEQPDAPALQKGTITYYFVRQ